MRDDKIPETSQDLPEIMCEAFKILGYTVAFVCVVGFAFLLWYFRQ